MTTQPSHGNAKRDANRSTGETSSFPITCETCLGDSPMLRMIRSELQKECKICTRPFTSFRWKAGTQGRYKTTIVCQTCARSKNLCQTCLFDLEYGLPAQVRDSILAQTQNEAVRNMSGTKDATLREYYANEVEKQMASGEIGVGRAPTHSAILAQLARTQPYYQRNRARVCSFFQKGECTRGAECPYRHETDTHDPALANQKIGDRFHGSNDPVAEKMLRKLDTAGKLVAPTDSAITTVHVGGVTSDISQQDLMEVFYGFGEVASIRLATAISSAFVTYTDRAAAERCVGTVGGRIQVCGKSVTVSWSKHQNSGANAAARPQQAQLAGAPTPGHYGAPGGYAIPSGPSFVGGGAPAAGGYYPPPSFASSSSSSSAAAAAAAPMYASANPSMMGAAPAPYYPSADSRAMGGRPQ